MAASSRPNTVPEKAASSATHFGAGKVILLGEHAVVYGYPAIAAPLELGVHATSTPASRCQIVPPEGLSFSERRALVAAFERASEVCNRPPIRVELKSTLPLSTGLGSSAAVSVACARVLLAAQSEQRAQSAKGRLDSSRAGDSAEAVAALAFEMERVFHGTPSGVDHTTSAVGRLIRFVRSGDKRKSMIRPLTSPKPLWLIVANAGKRGSTRETVGSLRVRAARWSKRYTRLFADIGRLVDEGVDAIESGDLENLGDVMNVNHGLLSAMGLSSRVVDDTVHALRGAGALGAKLSGAGGNGGAVIGLFSSPKPALAKLSRLGIPSFAAHIAGPKRA